MTRARRRRAQDLMWADGAAAVCGVGMGYEKSEAQERLAVLLDATARDRRVPLDVVGRLGEIVRLANLIGQGAP